MDQRLTRILEMLLANIDILNAEVLRLGRCDQFAPVIPSLQLIERIRGSCTCSLQNLRTIELTLSKRLEASIASPVTYLPEISSNDKPCEE